MELSMYSSLQGMRIWCNSTVFSSLIHLCEHNCFAFSTWSKELWLLTKLDRTLSLWNINFETVSSVLEFYYKYESFLLTSTVCNLCSWCSQVSKFVAQKKCLWACLIVKFLCKFHTLESQLIKRCAQVWLYHWSLLC